MSRGFAVLWNPSFRKSKILSSPFNYRGHLSPYSFGYDHFIHSYKIVAISMFKDKREVRVHVLGTDNWRKIQDFPYSCPRQMGIFVSGTVNWLTTEVESSSHVIVSFDLKNESYQKLPQPNLDNKNWTLGVSRECLCIFVSSIMFLDVWVMKEYGNKESWTKLYHVPNMENHSLWGYKKASYISKNDRLLMDSYENGSFNELKLVVYDSRKGTLKIVGIQNIHGWMNPEVYIESLIWPCS
jgi:F-box interacting protein